MLETNRLNIYPTSEANSSDILDYHVRNREYLKPYNPTPPTDFYTEAFWQRKIWQSQQEWQEDKSYRFVFRLKNEDCFPVLGTVNFTQVFRGPLQNCFMGYGIDQTFQGMGLMTEALEALVEYIFKKQNLHRISANYLVDNHRSGRVLEKLGFEKEGKAKQYLNIDGLWQDHILTAKISPYK